MATRHSELSCQYGKEKRGTLFSVGNGASRPIGCIEKLQTLELHWAESGPNTGAEHNVIVVTAKGQPFGEGILLDLWRYSGTLVWTHVGMDPDYRWMENKSELARRLGRTADVASKRVRSTTKTN